MNVYKMFIVVMMFLSSHLVTHAAETNPVLEMHIISLSKDVRSYIYFIKLSKRDNAEFDSYLDEKLSAKLEDFSFYLPKISTKDGINTVCNAHQQLLSDFEKITNNCHLNNFKEACGYFNEVSKFCNQNDFKIKVLGNP